MKYIIALFSVFYGYAFLRYHFGNQLDSSHILFVFNKAVAWSSAVYLGLSLLKLPSKFPSRRTFGLSSFYLSVVHVLLIFILAVNQQYPELYVNQTLTIKGVAVLISGVLTFIIMLPPFISTIIPNHLNSRFFHYGKIACIINLFHPLFLGYKNWLTPAVWPYFLPPITLLVVLMNVILIFTYYKKRST
jgi:hypothetical protein